MWITFFSLLWYSRNEEKKLAQVLSHTNFPEASAQKNSTRKFALTQPARSFFFNKYIQILSLSLSKKPLSFKLQPPPIAKCEIHAETFFLFIFLHSFREFHVCEIVNGWCVYFQNSEDYKAALNSEHAICKSEIGYYKVSSYELQCF